MKQSEKVATQNFENNTDALTVSTPMRMAFVNIYAEPRFNGVFTSEKEARSQAGIHAVVVAFPILIPYVPLDHPDFANRKDLRDATQAV